MSSVWAAAEARATGQWRLVSSVVRPLDTCCGFPQKARTSLALCIAGSTAVAGLGWTARRQEVRPHSSSTFLSSVASSLCKCRILRTAWAGLLWMSFAAKRPSAGEGKGGYPSKNAAWTRRFRHRRCAKSQSTARNIGGLAPITLAPSVGFGASFYPTNRRENRFRRILPPPYLPLTPQPDKTEVLSLAG